MTMEDDAPLSSASPASVLPAGATRGAAAGVGGVGGGLSVETRRGKALREGGAPAAAEGEAASRVAQLSLHHSTNRGGGGNSGVT